LPIVEIRFGRFIGRYLSILLAPLLSLIATWQSHDTPLNLLIHRFLISIGIAVEIHLLLINLSVATERASRSKKQIKGITASST